MKHLSKIYSLLTLLIISSMFLSLCLVGKVLADENSLSLPAALVSSTDETSDAPSSVLTLLNQALSDYTTELNATKSDLASQNENTVVDMSAEKSVALSLEQRAGDEPDTIAVDVVATGDNAASLNQVVASLKFDPNQAELVDANILSSDFTSFDLKLDEDYLAEGQARIVAKEPIAASGRTVVATFIFKKFTQEPVFVGFDPEADAIDSNGASLLKSLQGISI